MEPAGDEFGLHKFITSRGTSGGLIRNDTPVFSGSEIIENPTAEEKKGLLEEFYVDGDSGNPSVYLTCNGPSVAPSPGCSEIFTNNGLLYHLDYGKDHLSDWQSIKLSAIRLMQSFAYSASDKNNINKGE